MRLQLAVSLFLFLAAPSVKADVEEGIPANIDHATQSINALIGKPASDQVKVQNGVALFRFTNWTQTNNVFKDPSEGTLVTSENCDAYHSSSTNWYSTSSSSLDIQSSMSSTGFRNDVDLGISVPLGSSGAVASAETTISTALMYGNSKASLKAFKQKHEAYYRSFSSKVVRSVYTIKTNYDAITEWNHVFKKACESLVGDPSQTMILQFFREYGTHGFSLASFGQKCTTTRYMEGGQSSKAYSDYQSDSRNTEFKFGGFEDSSSESGSSKNDLDKRHGFATSAASSFCDGNLKEDFSGQGDCNMKGTDNPNDNPEIIDWKLKPIWEMEVPGFRDSAKTKMKIVFEKVLIAAVACSTDSCNGHGVCTPNQEKWQSKRSINGIKEDVNELFNGDKCFCFEGYEGNSCSIWRSKEDVLYNKVEEDVTSCGDSAIPKEDCIAVGKALGGTLRSDKLIEGAWAYTPSGCFLGKPDEAVHYSNTPSSEKTSSDYTLLCKIPSEYDEPPDTGTATCPAGDSDCGNENELPTGSYCLAGTSCNSCKDSYSWWYSKSPNGFYCGKEPGFPIGTYCFAGTSCNSCKDSYNWWYSKAPNGYYCGKEPGWTDGTYCLAGTSCDRCQNSYNWWYTKAPNGYYCGGKEPGWLDGTYCLAGTSCDRCQNSYNWWYTKAPNGYYCGKEPGWLDGTYCLAGTSCDSCQNSYSWWYSKAPNGNYCGKDPCFGKDTYCLIGTSCNSCCNSWAWWASGAYCN